MCESTIICIGCGRSPHDGEQAQMDGAPPDGWERTILKAVCPGCQFAEWHPYCTSVVDFDGERIDPAASEQELAPGLFRRCGFIDLEDSRPALRPTGWAGQVGGVRCGLVSSVTPRWPTGSRHAKLRGASGRSRQRC